MMVPLKVSRSTIAAQSLGSVKVRVGSPLRSGHLSCPGRRVGLKENQVPKKYTPEFKADAIELHLSLSDPADLASSSIRQR
jgi:hypothetical protein